MNNRIRELAQEAGIIYGTAVEYYYTRATDGVVSRQMEKFAELIVQDCLREIYSQYGTGPEMEDGTCNPVLDDAIDAVSAVVRFRFGIK